MVTDIRFKQIVVAANPQAGEALQEAHQVAGFLAGRGLEVKAGTMDDPRLRERVIRKEADLLIALGGDGTMLRAGHLCAPVDVPILGINLGRFGFLTEIQRHEWSTALPKLWTAQVWLERRLMLRAERWRDGEQLGTWQVVNEAVVSHGRIKRPIQLETSVDGHFLTTFIADGLIVSTPTGSTAYALAAGGPILPPDLRNILIVPVAPHLLIDRAVVLSEGSSISIDVKTSHEAVLAVDGQLPIDVEEGDRVEVCASEHNVTFVRLQDPSYFYRNITQYMNRNPAPGIRR